MRGVLPDYIAATVPHWHACLTNDDGGVIKISSVIAPSAEEAALMVADLLRSHGLDPVDWTCQHLLSLMTN